MHAACRSAGALVVTAMFGVVMPSLTHAQLLRANDVASLPSRAADLRVSYGSDSLQFGELRLPPGKGPFPVAIVIHGGCWLARFATLQSTAALSDALRDEGIASWNIEYRRTDHPGGGWPGTFTDAGAAADHLRILARTQSLDLTRVIATGHSAGAHLVLWLAGRHKLPKGSPLYAVNPLALSGVVPLGGPGEIEEFRGRDARTCGSAVIDGVMGGTPERVPERYADGSPVHLLPFGIPQWVVAGERDFIMPPSALAGWVKRVQESGDRVETIVIPAAGHFEVIAPTTAAWPRVRDAIRIALGMPVTGKP